MFIKTNQIRLFQHRVDYGDFNDSDRRTAADKILRDKAFNIAENSKYHGYQRGLASVFYQFFDKNNTSDEAVKLFLIKN